MKYRKVKVSESNIITDIHLVTFKGFFLTELGESFLNTYYSACLRSDESISICAIDDNNHIVGFCIGCIKSKGFHKRLVLHNFFSFLLHGIFILLIKPKAILRILKNMEKNKSIYDNGEYADILSIAVLPNKSGSGVGKTLVKYFEEAVVERKCYKVSLTTDSHNNENVIKFYKETGYDLFYKFTTFPNREMYKLIKKLDETNN